MGSCDGVIIACDGAHAQKDVKVLSIDHVVLKRLLVDWTEKGNDFVAEAE